MYAQCSASVAVSASSVVVVSPDSEYPYSILDVKLLVAIFVVALLVEARVQLHYQNLQFHLLTQVKSTHFHHSLILEIESQSH